MKILNWLLLIVPVLLFADGWTADQSCGCGTGLNDGVTASSGEVQCYLIETPAFSGTADSMVFFARDYDAGSGYGTDTAYAAVYTMDADSSVDDLVALSADSAEISGTSYVTRVVNFSGEAIAASTAYHLCMVNRNGEAGDMRFEACNDAPGAGLLPGSAHTVDAWPLENPSTIAYDNTAYAPNAVLWYTSENGEPVSVGARRRRIIIGQ